MEVLPVAGGEVAEHTQRQMRCVGFQEPPFVFHLAKKARGGSWGWLLRCVALWCVLCCVSVVCFFIGSCGRLLLLRRFAPTFRFSRQSPLSAFFAR